MLNETKEKDLQRATELRRQADMLTAFRDKAAHVIGPAMMVYGPNWPTEILTVAAAATDYFDGIKARQAEDYGIPPTYENKEDDHLADKKLAYFSLAGLLVRDIIDKHYVSAGIVGGVIAANAVRDIGMAKTRKQAHKSNLSTDAILPNRIKSNGIDLGIIIGNSPFADSKTGREVRNGILVSSTLLGITGLKIYRKQVANSLARS